MMGVRIVSGGSIARSSLRAAMLVTAATSALSWSQASLAQDAAVDSGGLMGDEIVVTARRREEDISKVPVAITAFSAEQLQERSIDTTADLVKVTPGLNIVQTATGSPNIVIRGQSRLSTGPTQPGVQTYFNDQALDVLNGLISTYDMDNIQVLKGPQGTLFGRNTIGGAVLTYSKKPTYNFSGYGQFEYGNYNQVRLEGALNLPIIKDVLAVRLAGEYTDSDGYTKTYQWTPATFGPNLLVSSLPSLTSTSRNYDAIRSKAFRVSVLFEPTDWIQNTTVYGYRRTKGTNNATFTRIFPGGFATPQQTSPYYLSFQQLLNLQNAQGQPAFGALQPLVAANLTSLFNCANSTFQNPCNIRDFARDFTPNGRHVAYAATPIDETYTMAQTLSNTTNIDLNDDLLIKNIFGWQKTDLDQSVDLDGTPFPIIESRGESELVTISNELQLQGQLFEDKLKFVVGGFWLRSYPRNPGGFAQTTSSALGGLSLQQPSNFFSSRSKALFGQIDYDLSTLVDGLSVTAGYRYTWDRAKGCTVSINYLPFTSGFIPGGKIENQPTKGECEQGTAALRPLPLLAPGLPIGSQRVDSFDVKNKKGTFTLALNWQATQDNLFYITTRRGYRTGGYNSPGFTGPNTNGLGGGTLPVDSLQFFEPEELNDIEIGTKNRFMLGSIPLTFEAALFRILTKDTQQFLSTSGLDPLPINGLATNFADLKLTGFEVAATIRPMDGLLIGGNIAHIDPKQRRVSISPELANVYARYNRQSPAVFGFNGISKWQYNAFVSYRVPGDVMGGTLKLNADYHKQSSSQTSDVIVKGYDTADARLTLEGLGGTDIDVSLYVKNMFDEYYFGGAQANTPSGTGIESYFVAPPRTYGFTVRYRFGE